MVGGEELELIWEWGIRAIYYDPPLRMIHDRVRHPEILPRESHSRSPSIVHYVGSRADPALRNGEKKLLYSAGPPQYRALGIG